MARKLFFGLKKKTEPFKELKPLDLWHPKGRKEWARLYVLPIRDFKIAVAKHGYDGRDIGGLAVYGRWRWPYMERDRLYLRADKAAALFLHEWRHIEEQQDFHGETT